MNAISSSSQDASAGVPANTGRSAQTGAHAKILRNKYMAPQLFAYPRRWQEPAAERAVVSTLMARTRHERALFVIRIDEQADESGRAFDVGRRPREFGDEFLTCQTGRQFLRLEIRGGEKAHTMTPRSD